MSLALSRQSLPFSSSRLSSTSQATTSARKRSWLPSGMTCVTLHSRLTGLSSRMGQSVSTEPGAEWSLQAANLSKSRPLLTPHQSTDFTSASVGRLMANWPLSLMRWWLYRSGRTLMDTMLGWVQMVPVQPMVMRLGLSSPPQETSTGGSGFRRVLPFQLCLLIRDTSFRREPMCVR